MSKKQKIRVTGEVIVLFVLLLAIWPLTFWTGYTESTLTAIVTIGIIVGALETYLYLKSEIQANAKESDPASREELERAADGIPIESTKTTEDVAQPVQLEEDLTESETNESTDSSQNREEKEKQVTKRPERAFSDEEKELFDKFRDLELVARSEAMLAVFNRIETFAPTDIDVLITGETGTGKEKIARAIHRLSSRSSGPFIAINCAGLTESLLKSELFGIEDKRATGVSGHEGKFEVATGGTLFLDEIGDMPIGMQATILRALQEKKIVLVGRSDEIDVDVRYISATNKNLDEEVRKKRFRLDLLSRIKKAEIVVPPLNERREDIPYLAEYFFRKQSQKQKLSIDIPLAAFKLLGDRHWEGNVRDLESHIQLVATVIQKHGRDITTPQLRKIIADPDAAISGYSESDEPILREKGDWNLLAKFVEMDFNLKKTAERMRKDRDLVTRRVSSICLRLGHHFKYDMERIISYLSSQGFLPDPQVEDFTNLLQKNWKAVIQFEKHPTTKPPYYADEKDLVQDLIIKKPDLG